MSLERPGERPFVIQAGALFVALLMMLSVTALVVLSSPQPVEAVAGDEVTVDVGQEVAFDASASTGAEPLQYLWFFGNGDAELGGLPSLSTDREATFAYGEEGVYEAILIVTDGLGRHDIDSRVVTVRNVLPTAVIAVDPPGTEEGLQVLEDEPILFSGSESEDTEELFFHWDFGDGREGAGEGVEHAYVAQGTYVARLEVMDPKGARNQSAVLVRVTNVEPVAAASFPSVAGEDETVLFDASATVDTPSDRAKLTYIWDLGDGTVKIGREVEHSYGLSEQYTVHLRVIDDNGASSAVEGSIAIQNEPPTAVLSQLLMADEGATVFFDASSSTDTPSDVPGLNYTWDFDLDGEADAAGIHAIHVFEDEGVFSVDLDLKDDDGAADSAFSQVLVANVPPSAGILGAFRLVDVNLTVAGTPGHTVTITILEGSAVLAEGSSTRRATDPAEHRVVFDDLRFSLAEGFVAIMEYEPLMDELGDNPAWLKLTYEDGSSVSLFHNFNVVQEETHLWEVDLDPLLTSLPVHLVGYAYDPGADDLTLRWDLGDGTTHAFAHPSDRAPTRVTSEVVHTFGLGTFALSFEAEDEDGGLGQDQAVVTSTEDGLFIDNVRPRAELGGTIQATEDEIVVFEATGQDSASDRDALSYRWRFRDGTEALGKMAEHAFAQAGTYHALLVVTDDSGEATIDSVQVEVRNISPLGAIVPIDPAFEDALLLFDGTSTVDTPSDAPALAFRWTFGDGSVGVGPVVSHAFPKAGNYVVTLVVQDNNGAFSEASVEVSISNVAPGASFEGPSTLFVEEAVPFLSTSEDTPSDEADLDLAWTLGDGTIAAGRELIHTFLAPGTFSVELTVTDDDGAVGLVAGTVEVQNRPPTAHIPFDLFMVYGTEGRASFRGLGFNGLADQGSLSFAWDFGDGSTGAGAEIEHAYGTSGSFVLTLTVEDPHGAVGTDTAVVNVILDGDLDGLPDLYESQVADTDPAAADTDEDGILDPFEILVFGTDPLLQDTDFDAWTDFEEVFAVHGYITDPLESDTDGDGLPDGSELYTQAFRTTQRFAIPEQGSVDVVLFGVATGAPDFALERADARLGIVHPRAGDLDLILLRNGNGRSSFVEVAFPDTPNLFVSVDLLEAGFLASELTSPATWTLEVVNAGGRGTVEYFEIHLAARTSPIALDSDGDGLNDTEETTPGDDGWITDPWHVDTDGDLVSDLLEVQGWKKTESAVEGDPEGFRTDPTRRDTDRDGVRDRNDVDPLHDVMVQITLDDYFALDNDPDLDDKFPEPFVEVEFQGQSFYTPHPYDLLTNPGPAGFFLDLDKVYTLDVPDFTLAVTFTFRAWDDDLIAGNDKQWDLDGTSTGLDHFVTLDLRDGSTGDRVAIGEGDGDASLDAALFYRIDTVRPGRIPTILVDSLDTDDLVETASGDLRYLGDDVVYVAWLDVTSSSGPFVEGLNAVLVPRAQFFNSSLNQTLQTTEDPGDLPAHLKDLVFTAFDETAQQTTDAIAGVLNGTLSGAQAELLLQGLLHGPDGSTNGAFTVVTDQLVTLGLPDRIVNAIPLAGIRFDEATGEGPGTFFSGFLDFILDAAAFVAQGLALIGTAIAAFFAEVVAFLGERGLAVIGAIAAFLGQVAEAVQRVGEVFLETIEVIIQQAERLIRSTIEPILGRLSEGIDSVVSSLAQVIREAAPSPPPDGLLEWDSLAVARAILEILLPVVAAIVAALTAMLALEIVLVVLSGGLGFLATTLADRALSIFLSALLITLIVGTVPLVDQLISGEDPQSFVAELFSGIGLVGAITGAVFEVVSLVGASFAGSFGPVLRALGVVLAMVGLIITISSITALSSFPLLILDLLAAAIAAGGFVLYLVGRRSDVSKATTFFAKLTTNLELGLAITGVGGSVLTVLARQASGAYEEP